MKRFGLFALFFICSFKINSQIGAELVTPTSGTLSGVSFEFSNFATDPITFTSDLSGEDFSAAPLGSSEQLFTFIADENWTVTFDSPISNLRLYCRFWRSGLYDFDQPFIILSGNENFESPIDNQLRTITFSHGIIEFVSPITTLNLIALGGHNAYQAITFGVPNTLSFIDVAKTEVKLYPNPSRNFIWISGLIISENYKIYNVLGSEVKRGAISNNEIIDIRNLNSGLYVLKIDNGSALKFLKL